MTMRAKSRRPDDIGMQIRRAVILLIVDAVILIVLIGLFNYAFAEDYYVLCRPGGEINVREKPKLKSGIVGVYNFGDKVTSDGKEKNGFVHVVDVPAEVSEGWIYGGLLVKDEPIASPGNAMVFGDGRVACRKYAGGKVVRWLEEESVVKIYAISEEWCVTEYGYVRTEFLTVNAKVRQP